VGPRAGLKGVAKRENSITDPISYRTLGRPAHSLISILTELPRILIHQEKKKNLLTVPHVYLNLLHFTLKSLKFIFYPRCLKMLNIYVSTILFLIGDFPCNTRTFFVTSVISMQLILTFISYRV